MWDDDQFQCLYVSLMTKDQYKEQNPNNQYNEWACTLIVGAGYTFDANNHKCILLKDTQNFGCSEIQMNNYACQFLTKGFKCYFDQNEIPPNKKCKIFNFDQSICTTDYAINIEVCMNIQLNDNKLIIPKTFFEITIFSGLNNKFSLKTMSCLTLEVKMDVTCLDLQILQNKGEYVNKLGCSSISESLEGNDGEYQCYQNKEFVQQCNYQKFCFWDDYTCKVSKQQIHIFDKNHYIVSQQSYWVFKNNNCTNSDQCNKYVTEPEKTEDGLTYLGKSENLECGLGRCDYTNEPCSQKDDCQEIAIENLQLNDDGSIRNPIMQNQTCQSTCQKSLKVQECQDSETPLEEVLSQAKFSQQNCQGRCSNSSLICESQENNPCGYQTMYNESWNLVYNVTTNKTENIIIFRNFQKKHFLLKFKCNSDQRYFTDKYYSGTRLMLIGNIYLFKKFQAMQKIV